MAYATLFDLETRYGADEIAQLADRDGIVSDVIAAALDDASTEIDAYLVVRYSLPLAEIPDLLTLICCDIARYRLWSDDATEQIRQRYDDAVSVLGKLSKGTAQLLLGADDAKAAIPATPDSRVSMFTDDILAMMP